MQLEKILIIRMYFFIFPKILPKAFNREFCMAGFEQIAAIFSYTADNEKEHAELWFRELGELGDTPFNLKHAAEG